MLVARLVTCVQSVLQRPLPAVTAPCIYITQHHRYCSRPPTPARLIREERLQVRPYYGSLHLKGDLSYVVKPDLEHQCGSVCCVQLFAAPGCTASIQLTQSPDKDELTIVGQREEAAGEEPKDGQAHCEITLPIKYDLNAELTGHGGLSIEELQNDTTNISTITGTTTIRKLQCPLMHFNTHDGPLAIPGKLLASVEAQGRSLTISGNAVQAGSLSLRAEEVSVLLQSVHAGSFSVETGTATLAIKDITAASQLVADRAHVRIGNCSGSMLWRLGEATVRLGVPQLEEDSNITVDRGTVTVACPAEYRYGIGLQSTHVTVHPDFEDFKVCRNKSQGTSQLGDGVVAPNADEEERTLLQDIQGGLESPRLSVLVKQGAVEVLPWAWPITPGLL